MMLSYQYYIQGRSLVPDSDYDTICRYLLDNYDKITHEHKRFFTRQDLEAGTGYSVARDDYPNIVVYASEEMFKDLG